MTKTLMGVILGLVILGIATPFLVYHFLISPNIIGVISYLVPGEGHDPNLTHMSYWFGFWIFMPGIFGLTCVIYKET